MALRGVSKQRPRRDREGWVGYLGRLSFETGARKRVKTRVNALLLRARSSG
jgi:hypothetical protein